MKNVHTLRLAHNNSMTVAPKHRTRGILLSRPHSPTMISVFNCKRSMSISSPVPSRVYLNPDKEKDLIVNENTQRVLLRRLGFLLYSSRFEYRAFVFF